MRVPRSLARLAVGLAGTHLGLRLAPSTTRAVGPVDVTAAVGLSRQGGVRVDVPPLGSARLGTHRGPLQLRAVATNVEPDRAAGLLRMPTDQGDAQDVRTQLDTVLTSVAPSVRGLAATAALRAGLAGLAGAAGLAAVTLRRPRDVAAATAASAASLAAAAALAAASADRQAWRDPELSGLLTRAPLLIGDLQQAPARIGVYRDQLADLIRTATGVQRRVATLPGPPPDDAIRLVHVSDIHLSPVAFPLAKALVEQYRADAVIDTGDLVDWGTPAENAFAGQIPGLGVPYVYVKGNHDSTGIAAAVGRQPNAVVLDSAEASVDVAGLRFVGMPDPRFTPDKTTGDDRAHHRVSEAADVFAGRLRASGAAADIALVHSPTAGRALEGLVPLVLAGDIHRREARRYGDTTVLVQGSSGGAGLRGVQQDPPTPFTLSVLYVDRATKRLWGADEITLGGLGQADVSVVRRTAADLLGEG